SACAGFAHVIVHSEQSLAGSRFITPAARSGPSCLENSGTNGRTAHRLIEIEVTRRLGHGFIPGLLQRLLETPRQRIAARPLGLERVLESGLTPGGLFREDTLCFAQLGLVSTLRFLVAHDSPEIGIDNESRLAAGTGDFQLRLQPHGHFLPPIPFKAPSPVSSNCFFNSSGWPFGSFAVSRRSRICARRKSNRCPSPATNTSSGARKRPPA